ncbi:MAG: hypothetical protein C9356_16835 [Oleiphilus sp.]|nr:MAG: hypothetical protein C9356_16835 [Oleiphilus sp.]
MFHTGQLKRLFALMSHVMLVFVWHLPAFAYDDDRTISQVDFNPESFLDINAASFRRALELDWLAANQGFRMAGGSISSNRLYLNSELRLHEALSRQLIFGLSWEQDDFYADRPTGLPQLAVNVYPVENSEFGMAVIGTAAHDKRQADLGYALLWGREPDNHIRFSWLKVDAFHNEKNEFDNDRYTEAGETLTLEGVTQLTPQWLVEFSFERDRPLSLDFDNGAGRFDHKRYEHHLTLYHRYTEDAFWGLEWRILDIAKSRLDVDDSQAQILEYQSFDMFWVGPCCRSKEMTLGLRYDRFDETRANRVVPDESFDYRLSTTQLYASVHDEFTTHQAWDVGLYAGWSNQDRDYAGSLPEGAVEERAEGLEAKLRGSWEYHSANKNSVIRFSLALNLDDVFNDPGDGGAIYYYSRF